nr:hypothetical protein [Candidatus Sigynarchaeota archaeon]
MRKRPGIGSEITTFVMRVYSVASAILGGTWCFGLASMMWGYPGIFTVEPWYQLVLGILLVSASAYGYFLSNHRVSIVVLAPVAVYVIGEMIYTPYIRLNRVFGAWQFFGVVQSIYGVLLLIGVAFSLLHIIFVGVRQWKVRQGLTGAARHATIKENIRSATSKNSKLFKKYKVVHFSFIFLIAGSGFLTAAFVNNWFISPTASVTLHPGNYQTKFQFYGPSDYALYNQSLRESLNALGVRIITGVADFITYADYTQDPYMWWMNLTNYKQTQEYKGIRDGIIAQFNPWKVNATNITFLCALHAIPCSLPTDYSVTTGYWGVSAMLFNAWLTAEVIVEANLTNVVGFHTDQEGMDRRELPVGGALNQSFQEQRDYERNMQARENYLAFFHRLRYYEQTNATWSAFASDMNKTYGVDHILFTTTYGDLLINDGLDNDWDMDTFAMNNINTLPFDEFLPMLYNQHRFPPDCAHYALYYQCKRLQATLERAGYPGRIGVLLGCMGTLGSMFIGNYTGTQFVNGTQQVATGFDVIARQAMIAKAFNCTWISFFPFHSYPEQDILGINETFDASFFDQLNATVNGPGSEAPFSIRYFPDVSNGNTDLARDLFLSVNWTWFYLVALIAGISVVGVHETCIRRRRKFSVEKALP